MKTKVLVIGVVKKGDAVLMRKKPDGSLPYKETWYLFGGEALPGGTPEEAIVNEVKAKSGVDVEVSEKILWDTEVKNDLDGEEKFFIYLDTICNYLGGELKPSADIERLEWVPISELQNYDLVPPSRELFEKLGYLK
jgi:8-oxo-dGTP pyrophosphatase MutT (NUDIX family)